MFTVQRYSKIISVFLLGVFGLFLLHQFLPHVHHDHDHVEVSIEHSDSHHDHHNECDNDGGSFHFLLSIHAHTLLSSNHFSLEGFGNHQLGHFKNSIDQSAILISNFKVIQDECSVAPRAHHPPDLRQPLFLTTLSHRGPPHLG
ncbi:MAG: hypothetical protein AAGF85_18595 [Bacteroidota bacterium]